MLRLAVIEQVLEHVENSGSTQAEEACETVEAAGLAAAAAFHQVSALDAFA